MAERRQGFWLTLPGFVTGLVGFIVATGGAIEAIRPKPIEIPVRICSGNACQPSDWAVGIPKPDQLEGDCDVVHVAREIPDWAYVDEVKQVGETEAISGAATDFRIITVAMHPNALDNPAVSRNLKLCGAVPDTRDRRATVKVEVTFKWWSRLSPRAIKRELGFN